MARQQDRRLQVVDEHRDERSSGRPRQADLGRSGRATEVTEGASAMMEGVAARAGRGQAAHAMRPALPRQGVLNALRSRASLKQAMLLQEILGSPKALQQPDESG